MTKLMIPVLVICYSTVPHSMKVSSLPIKSSFSIAPKIYISRMEEGDESWLGAIKGVRSCGGHGQLIQLRYEICSFDTSELSTSSEERCQIPGDGEVRKSELEFIPSRSVNAMGVNFLVINDNGEVTTLFESTIDDSAVDGGQKYVMHAMVGPNLQLRGKTVKLQYMIYRLEDDNVEVCAETYVHVV